MRYATNKELDNIVTDINIEVQKAVTELKAEIAELRTKVLLLEVKKTRLSEDKK